MIYLIDSENMAGSIWGKVLTSLRSDDGMLVFYTKNSQAVSIASMLQLIHSGRVEFVECTTGSNALDFQLVSILGFLIGSTAVKEYTIVSDDSGYDSVVNLWNQRGIQVRRIKKQDVSSEAVLSGTVQSKESEHCTDKKPSQQTEGKVNIFHELVFIFDRNPNLVRKTLHLLRREKEFKNQLQMLGNPDGNAYSKILGKHMPASMEEKERSFVQLYAQNNPKVRKIELGEEDYSFIVRAWNSKKKLNSFRMKLINHYSNGVGMVLYGAYKPVVELIEQIK